MLTGVLGLAAMGLGAKAGVWLFSGNLCRAFKAGFWSGAGVTALGGGVTGAVFLIVSGGATLGGVLEGVSKAFDFSGEGIKSSMIAAIAGVRTSEGLACQIKVLNIKTRYTPVTEKNEAAQRNLELCKNCF